MDSADSAAAQNGGSEDALTSSLVGLSRLAMGRGPGGLAAMLTHVAEFAVKAIPGADGAGLTLQEANRADTLVATRDFVREVDAIQYGLGEGPCISAAASGEVMRSGSLGEQQRWPRFGVRVARLGVHSVLSIPLIGDEGVLGSMNVYAHAPDVFDERAAELGQLYSVPAAISVQNAQALFQAQRLATELQAALTSRTVIDQAIGILMSRSGCGSDDAFGKLRSISQSENRKLSAVAQHIVDEAVRRARARRAAS